MNYHESDTAGRILATARELFAVRGYDGTSIRAISTKARVNLGAVTYHFGSKSQLYAEVIESVVGPLRDRVMAVAGQPGAPLDRLARIIAVYFDHFALSPDMPKLVIQQIFTGRALSPALQESMGSILGALATVIRAGQEAGQVRAGPPVLLALSLLSQPIYFNIVRGPLAQAGVVSLDDPAQLRAVVDHVTQFALAGLAPRPGVHQ